MKDNSEKNVKSPHGTTHKIIFLGKYEDVLCGNNGGNHYYNDGSVPLTWKHTYEDITCKSCLKMLSEQTFKARL